MIGWAMLVVGWVDGWLARCVVRCAVGRFVVWVRGCCGGAGSGCGEEHGPAQWVDRHVGVYCQRRGSVTFVVVWVFLLGWPWLSCCHTLALVFVFCFEGEGGQVMPVSSGGSRGGVVGFRRLGVFAREMALEGAVVALLGLWRASRRGCN